MADGVVLIPPAGSTSGGVRIREQQRPLRPLRALINTIVDDLAGGPPQRTALKLVVSPIRRLTTSEGEHAALFTIRAALPGQPELARSVGIIVGDDSYTQIDGAASEPAATLACQEVVNFLTEHYFLGLGADRRRAFEYQPPPGWQPLRRSHGTSYYPPGYPKRAAIITAYLTRPTTISVPELTDRMVFMDALVGVQRDPEEPARALKLASGLAGRLSRITGVHPIAGRVLFYQATLHDTRFTYIVDLQCTESTEHDSLQVFLDTAYSVQPIPANQTHASSGLLIQWAD